MKLSALSESSLRQTLALDRGLDLKIGPFWANLVSPLSQVSAGLSLLYADYPAGHADGVPDFHIELRPPGLLRTWLRPQTNFYLDGHSPFKPLPKDQAFAMFEWGLNWCVANYAHQYLNIHAAVVERDGMALILPGEPGSGKSTLCAALISQGWRLLSDEMTLVNVGNGRITPIPRPVALKNQSIDIIQSLSPGICQDRCRLFDHAARHFSSLLRSGFNATDPTGSQFRVWPDHRAGLAAFACS